MAHEKPGPSLEHTGTPAAMPIIGDADPHAIPDLEQLIPPTPEPTRRNFAPHSLISLKGILSRGQREAGRAQREREKELDFQLDLVAIRGLNDINRNIERYPVIVLPQPNIATQALQDEYASGDTTSRKRVKNEASRTRSIFQRVTIGSILTDVRELMIDTGEAPEKATASANQLIGALIGNKRSFDQLNREAQIAIVRNALSHRDALLIANGEKYIYLLAGFAGNIGVTQSEIEELRKRFREGDQETKLATASETRLEAERIIEQVMEANLPRLRRIEATEGESHLFSERVEEEFEDAPLTSRARLLERVIDRKYDLSMKHLPEIYRLRTLLYETPYNQPDETTRLGGGRERLIAEVKLVIDSLEADSKNTSLGEPTDEDLAKTASNMWARYYKDPSITKIAGLVLLLRNDAS